MVFGFRGVWPCNQQATQSGLSPGRGVGGGAVSGFSLFELGGVTGFDLNIRQADLCIAITQVRQLPIVLLCHRGVAAFEGFVGQALIGQASATAKADRHGEAQQGRGRQLS